MKSKVREYLKDLSFSLIKPHLEERVQKPGLNKHIINNLKNILSSDITTNPMLGSDKLEKRKRCNICTGDRDKVKKTLFCCAKCKKPVCDDHRIVCCDSCVE